MKTVVIPPGTAFGRLTVIREAARAANGKRAMLCRCECGRQVTVILESLRSGNTKSCGCRGVVQADVARLKPGEVPLYGKKAQGRVALVDIEDYDLVMQYRWNVQEVIRPGRHPLGPYACTTVRAADGRKVHLRMHNVIMGIKGVDHVNLNTLDNQRQNLRPATGFQNASNQRGRLRSASKYKGVTWNKSRGKWHARIAVGRNTRHLGFYVSEIEAALAYDAAAREAQGEYAYPNFPEGIPEELRERLRAEGASAEAAATARRLDAKSVAVAEWWAQREAATYTCAECGQEFTSRSTRAAVYCSIPCCSKAMHRRGREKRERERAAS